MQARERVSRMLKQFLAEERGALFKSGTVCVIPTLC